MRVALSLIVALCLAWPITVVAQSRDPFFRQAYVVPATNPAAQMPSPNSYLEARVESFGFGAGGDLISNNFSDVLRRIFRSDSGSVALTVKVSTNSGATSGTQILSTFNLANKQLTRFVEFNRPVLPPTLLQPGDNVRFEFRLVRLKQSLPSETQKLLSSFADLPSGPWIKAFQAFGDTFIDTYRDLTATPNGVDDAAVYNLPASALRTDQLLVLTRYTGAPVSAEVVVHNNGLTDDLRRGDVDHIFVRLRTTTEVLTPLNTLAENSRLGPALGLVMTPYLSRAREATSMEAKFQECARMRSHLRSMALLSDADVVNVIADSMAAAQFDPDATWTNSEQMRHQCLSQDELASLRSRHAFTLGSCQNSCANAKNLLDDWRYSASTRYTTVRWVMGPTGNGTGSVAQMSQRWALLNYSPLQRDTTSGAAMNYRTFACVLDGESGAQSVVNLSVEADPGQGRALLVASPVPQGQRQGAPACNLAS